MPPVRWKLFIAVTLICLTQKIARADPLHESMQIASDGWRPIIGTSQREVQDEITLYKNPSQTDEEGEVVKASVFTPPPTSATKPYQTISTSKDAIPPPTKNINNGNKPPGIKVSHHPKHNKPFMLTPNHGHGPHIPLTSTGHRGPPLRHSAPNKLPIHQPPNGKRTVKPVRGPMIAHSMKNEVIVPAPSAAIGTFTFLNQNRGPPKSQGPGGGKHFHISQPPPGHFDFANQFALSGIPGTNDVIIQQVPVQTLLIQNRNPIQNNPNIFINQNDEYTRNLVPPPYKPYQEPKEKQKVKQKEQSSVTESVLSINNPQLIIGKPKDGTRHRTVVPENIIVQLPQSFRQQSQFGSSFNHQQKNKDQDVQVQVTKEKLKVFHNNVPPGYTHSEEQYEPQYSFQPINKPSEDPKIFAFENFQFAKDPKPEIKPPTFRKPLVETYPVFEEQPKRERFKKPISEPPNFPTYEVTEGKNWQEPYQSYVSTRPSVSQENLRPQSPPRMEFIFLPTPYSVDGSAPTSPTQSEISTIYAELNNRNRPAHHDFSTLDPNYFSIKEVSTHYPIVGRPESPALFAISGSGENTEFSNEITAAKEERPEPAPEVYQPVQPIQPVEEPEPINPPMRTPPVRDWQAQRQRPHQRRRKPQRTRTTTTTTTTTTTEEPAPITQVYEVQKTHSSEENNYSGERYRPHRRRRPSRVRTTQATTTTEGVKSDELAKTTAALRQRVRTRFDFNRIRPTASAETIEEMPANHKMTEAVTYPVTQPEKESFVNSESNSHKPQQTTEDIPASTENDLKIEEKIKTTDTEIAIENYPKLLSFGKNYRPVESEEDVSATEKDSESQTEMSTTITTEEISTQPRRRMRLPTTTTALPTTITTTIQPTINIYTPENEIDYDYSTPSTIFEPSKETISIQEIYSSSSEAPNEATLATTTAPTTTTTTEIPTTRSHRIRGRPMKYDNKNRPRFSVKEYRQRLNQYSSSSSSTTETPRISTEISRTRFPSRSRKPLVVLQEEEPSTERVKFTPKDPRHGSSISNPRLRQFSRQRSTTEVPSTTPKVSIKPNIFSSLRRPPSVSLRQRIMNKYNRTGTQERTTTEKPEPEGISVISETAGTTIPYNIPTEPVTEAEKKVVLQIESTNEDNEENEDDEENEEIEDHEENEEHANQNMANTEIMKNEAFLQSQRVADLTLSAHKDYDTPGLFKSVSPNSRIVPNYFTISTDDPILPIEAFFPNIKDLNPKSDS